MDTIDRIRAFNRFYTHQIGLVGRNYVGGGLSLSELRVLYELRQDTPPTARHLASWLGLDEGYLSRILKSFEKRGWLGRRPDPDDRRIMQLKLSKSGYARSDEFVAQARERTGFLIENLDQLEQHQVVEAMDVVQSLLTRAPVKTKTREMRPGDAGWLIQQHAELYQRDEGFDQTFEALVAEVLADFIKSHDPACERAFIVERDGQRLGSIFCVRENAVTAKLRLFLLVPQARGLGLGKQLLSECMAFAKQAGYRQMKLWTHESHRAACALYASAGWQLTDSTPVRAFGADMVEQSWRVDL